MYTVERFFNRRVERKEVSVCQFACHCRAACVSLCG